MRLAGISLLRGAKPEPYLFAQDTHGSTTRESEPASFGEAEEHTDIYNEGQINPDILWGCKTKF